MDFTELVHQKRDAAASLANGLVHAKGKQQADNSMSGNFTKALGLTKKMTVRMIEDEQNPTLNVPTSLSNRRATAQKKKNVQEYGENLDINSESMADSSH
jgi:hypothetical protein